MLFKSAIKPEQPNIHNQTAVVDIEKEVCKNLLYTNCARKTRLFKFRSSICTEVV